MHRAGHVLMLLALLGNACATVQHRYALPDYSPAAVDSVKHVVVSAWTPTHWPEMAQGLSSIATDLVKLHTNYLVHALTPASVPTACLLPCPPEIQGLIVIRALAASRQDQDLQLHLAVELYRCRDAALLWRVDGALTATTEDKDLKELTESYTQRLGATTRVYAAPAFVLLKELLADMPNPTLTDEDIEQKILLESE